MNSGVISSFIKRRKIVIKPYKNKINACHTYKGYNISVFDLRENALPIG